MIDTADNRPILVDTSFDEEHAKQELARLTSERERLSAERDQRASAGKLAAQLAAAKVALADEQAIANAESELGTEGVDFAIVRSPLGCVIVKRPNHMRYRRWQDAGKYKSEDVEVLVTPCLVYPDRASFDALCMKFPAMLETTGSQVIALAGHKMQEAAGK